jgi:Sigma-70 region 2
VESAPHEGDLVATPDLAAGDALQRETLQSQLLAASRGDEAAFAALYDSVAPRAYGLVLQILRDVHQSAEVTQEVFLQVWETSNRFDPARGSALSWVMTMGDVPLSGGVSRHRAGQCSDHAVMSSGLATSLVRSVLLLARSAIERSER